MDAWEHLENTLVVTRQHEEMAQNALKNKSARPTRSLQLFLTFQITYIPNPISQHVAISRKLSYYSLKQKGGIIVYFEQTLGAEMAGLFPLGGV